MIPQKQLNLHKPTEGIWGDCYRTCIACLLDMAPADVPHFYDGPDIEAEREERRAARDAWLHGRGFSLVTVGFDCDLRDLLRVMEHNNPGTYYILAGFSRTGVNHVVIACGGEIVHDPSLTDGGIIGRCDDGYHWVEFLVPIAMKAAA